MIASRSSRWVIVSVAVLSGAGGIAWWFGHEPAVAPREPVVDTHRSEDFTAQETCPFPSRASTDPRNAYVLGMIMHNGFPVAGAQIEAITSCTAAMAIADTTTSMPDGTFRLVITAGPLVSRRPIDVIVFGDVEGHKVLTLAPGDIVRNVVIQVEAR
jgi:hypothetical protein